MLGSNGASETVGKLSLTGPQVLGGRGWSGGCLPTPFPSSRRSVSRGLGFAGHLHGRGGALLPAPTGLPSRLRFFCRDAVDALNTCCIPVSVSQHPCNMGAAYSRLTLLPTRPSYLVQMSRIKRDENHPRFSCAVSQLRCLQHLSGCSKANPEFPELQGKMSFVTE